ncbi:MAG: ABC transporter permease [Myxococcales bacterium]
MNGISTERRSSAVSVARPVSERLPAGPEDERGVSATKPAAPRAVEAGEFAREQSQEDEALGGDLEQPRYLGARSRPRWLSLGLRVSVPLALGLTWWIGSATGAIPSSIVASPRDVALAFVELQQSGQLQEFLAASLVRAALGVSLGVTAGLLLGVVAGLSALGEELVDPTMQMLRAVPFLAVVPLYISWFGIGDQFKVVLIASSSAMPMYAYSYLGVRGVDRKVVEAARSFGLNGAGLLLRVILPSALPNLLMALRICLAISVVGLIAAEQVGTTKGIGYLVLLAKQYYRQDYMVLCVALYALLGIAFDLFIRALERVTMPWRRYTTVRG